MTLARIIYHEEDGAWWAESPQFPSFFAAGDSLEEAKDRVREALPLVSGYGEYVGMMHIIGRGGLDDGALGERSGMGHVAGLVPA